MSKITKSNIKIYIFTNNFAITYNMYGMKKPIPAFVFRKKLTKSILDSAVQLWLTLFLWIGFFPFDFAWLVSLK